ncbi:MAG: hypothetical protein D6760_09960 [Deltaproteobacteria bacterium]|nr:MAG: hypothetical protein D6760_09960 [Deltaproteobacteria bacterium]
MIGELVSQLPGWLWRDSVWLALDRFGILIGDLFLLAAIVGVLRRDRVKAWFRRNQFPRIGGVASVDPSNVAGLLLLVSRLEVPKWLLQELRPQAIALVHTPESRRIADEIATYGAAMGIQCCGDVCVDDPDDPQASHAAVGMLIERLLKQFPREQCAVDTTGGKLPMSLGAFMAAEEAGVPSLYVSADFDARLRRPRPGTARVVRLSSPY